MIATLSFSTEEDKPTIAKFLLKAREIMKMSNFCAARDAKSIHSNLVLLRIHVRQHILQ